MKHLLFISQSALTHNLMEVVLRNLPVTIRLHSAANFEEAKSFIQKKQSVHLILVDHNALTEPNSAESVGDLKKSLKAPCVLFYPAQKQIDQNLSALFDASYKKPFLTEELTTVIMGWVKNPLKKLGQP